MYGKDHEYANSRLNETIVRRGDVPIWVYGVKPGMLVQYVELSKIEEHEAKMCPIDELDLHPVPLGYCNYNKHATYLCRMPMRRDWRQGLRRGNFTGTGAIDPHRIPYESIAQTIIGDYPSFKGALGAVKKIKSVAWHRHWAVDSALQVFYKGRVRPVGNVVGEAVILEPSYTYLNEALKESL
jgi:hypothetical protein